jgi:hypothetical protein
VPSYRFGRAGAFVHRSLVGSCGGLSPVRCSQSNAIDRHRVAIEVLPVRRREEAGNVREPVLVVRVIEVRVPHVVDEHDRVVAVTRVVVVRQADEPRQDRVRPVAIRRDAERLRLLRQDVVVELIDEVRNLLVGDRGPLAVAAVAVREGGVGGTYRPNTRADVPNLCPTDGRSASGGRGETSSDLQFLGGR